jgi:hypothetical protein
MKSLVASGWRAKRGFDSLITHVPVRQCDQEFASRNKLDKLIRPLSASRHAGLVNAVLHGCINIPDGLSPDGF